MPFHRQSRPKLTKTRSSDNTTVLASTDAYLSANHSRTSFSDLKSSARTTLPRQSTFPEDIGTAAELPPLSKNRLSRVSSASALNLDAGFGTSSTTVNSLEPKRIASGASMESQRSPGLPALPESMSKIDIEQAINLLQELKRTASPEELVSLHKALLPTREVSPVPPPQLSSIEEHAAFSALSGRVRSARPPGLATRGSILEDPLRSQEEVAAKSVKPKESREDHGAWFQETMSAVHARTCSMTSTGTAPDSSYSRTGGAYGLGTLRITNGRANSPEPGLVSKLASSEDQAKKAEQPKRRSEEAPVPASSNRDEKSLKHQRRHSQDSINSSSALSLAQRRQQQWGLRTSRPIPSLSSVVQPKIQGLENNESRLVQRPADLNQKRDMASLPSTLRVATNVPRYEQRWNHRASHLSNEYLLDCDISSSPYDDQVHELPECAKRLSTVKDNEAEDSSDSTGGDACAQALLQLTSSPDTYTPQAENEGQSSTEAKNEELNVDMASSPRFSFDAIPNRPQVMQKQDSGYCSEISNSTSKHTSPSGSKKSTALEPTPEQTTKGSETQLNDAASAKTVVGSPTFIASSLEPGVNMQQTPKKEAALDSPRLQPVSVETKKRLSPLSIFKSRNRASKRNSIAVDASPPVNRSNDGLPRSSSAQGHHSTPAKVSSDMRRKTLQKRMPEPVRHKREEIHKARQSMDVSQAIESEPTTDSSSPGLDQPRTVIKHVPLARNASDADDELSNSASPTAKPTRSWGRRSKSFARRRSKTIQEEEHEDSPATKVVPESAPERRRSKSLAGPGTPVSRRPSVDAVTHASCIRGSHQTAMQPHPGFQSVARSLEAVPLEKGDGNAVSSVPTAVRNASLRSKKSRDSIARTAARRHHAPAPAVAATPARSHTPVQDLYPEWQSKPASEASSPAAQEVQIANALPPVISHRPALEAIPPLPELPADLDSILCKADLLMSKKLMNSPKTSPRGSARNSIDSGRRHRANNAVGHGGQDQDLSMSLFSQTVVGEPPMAEAPSDSEMPAEADGTPLHRRQFSFEPLAKPTHMVAEAKSHSPRHDAQHSGWPGWAQQSARWRQRSSIVGNAAELPCGDDTSSATPDPAAGTASPASPSIVVSRYNTPLGSENAANRSNSAHKRSSTVQVISHPSGDSDKENDVDTTVLRRSNSIVSTATYVTMTTSDGRPAKVDVARTDSAFAQTTTTTTTTTMSHYTSNNGSATNLPSTGNRSASQTGLHSKYMPYRPADSMHAERSRALNMASRSCQVKDADTEKLKVDCQPHMARRASTEVFDRYGGGLGYGWDRQAGLVGSAGTRNTSKENLNRKSVKMSEEWGLDLSDVPVFLQRRVQ
ncbi:hypothetical protein Slin15195_G111610 [Septoria linicola]|uniref:Uncharacterized protein n=1 Tax=Septoria linicola TaxID=215465 RepID=A0A9Q9EPL1_9PEZI|nr:hypothetical protein Slin15195_G111610 [Septoria linicola]